MAKELGIVTEKGFHKGIERTELIFSGSLSGNINNWGETPLTTDISGGDEFIINWNYTKGTTKQYLTTRAVYEGHENALRCEALSSVTLVGGTPYLTYFIPKIALVSVRQVICVQGCCEYKTDDNSITEFDATITKIYKVIK